MLLDLYNAPAPFRITDADTKERPHPQNTSSKTTDMDFIHEVEERSGQHISVKWSYIRIKGEVSIEKKK